MYIKTEIKHLHFVVLLKTQFELFEV